MRSLSQQFSDKIHKQFDAFRIAGAKTIAQGIVTQMEQNVDRGVGFDSGIDKYQRKYEKRTIRERKKGGYQTAFADLQRADKRVKSAFVDTDALRATIRFARGGKILLYHQWGLDFNPRRQLFPDIMGGGRNAKGSGRLAQAGSMPQRIIKQAHVMGAKLMNRPVP